MNRKSLFFISVVLVAFLSLAPVEAADELDRIKAAGEMKIAMNAPSFFWLRCSNDG